MARLVIAFGGNALIREDERGTWPEQTAHALEAARAIARMRARRHEVVLTHGNGPQVGALALQQAIGEPRRAGAAARRARRDDPGRDRLPAPAGARRRRPVAADRDRAHARARRPTTTRRFAAAPTKPIGPFYDEDEARRLARERGWHVAPDAGPRLAADGPQPAAAARSLERRRTIALLAERRRRSSSPPAAAASRWRWRDGHLVGLDAVIDKDRCAAELAVALRRRPARARHRRAARGARLRHALAARHGAAPHRLRRAAPPRATASSRPAAWARRSRARRASWAAGGQRRDHRRRAPGRRACDGDARHAGSCPTSDGPSVFAPAPVAA